MVRGISVAGFVAAAVTCFIASPARSAEGPDGVPVVFNSGFETGDLSYWGVSGNAPVVQSTVVREGRYAIKSVIDRYDTTQKVNYRTEVVPRGIDISPTTTDDVWTNVDMWYGFSVYLPTTHTADRGYEIVAQWHDVPDPNEPSRNPIIAFWAHRNTWSISNLWDADAMTTYTIKSTGGKEWSYDGSWSYDLGPIELGKWTDWVVHVRWSWTNSGVLQIWKNGVLMVDQQGKPNCFNDRVMPYFKMGMYKGWVDDVGAATKREVFHDAFKMAVGPGVTYKDVAPGGGTIKAPAAPTALRVQ